MDVFQRNSKSATVSLSATTTSSRIALVGPSIQAGGQVRVAVGNVSGATFVYIDFGDVTITATATSPYAMLPNTVEVFTVGAGATYIAALTDSGTAVVKAVAGLGA